LGYLKSSQAVPDSWLPQLIQALNEIQKPSAEVTLAAVRPVRMLLEAVAQKSLHGTVGHDPEKRNK
jgi:hypothetical protein